MKNYVFFGMASACSALSLSEEEDEVQGADDVCIGQAPNACHCGLKINSRLLCNQCFDVEAGKKLPFTAKLECDLIHT